MKSELVTAIGQLASEKGVSKEAILEAVEAALVSAYKRNENSLAEQLTAKIDPGTQEFRIYHDRTVVEGEPETPDEISLAEARETDPKVQVGGTVSFDVTTRQFGRIAAQTAKQVVLQKLREAERKKVFDDFNDRKDEIVHGVVQRLEAGNVVIELNRAEALMPKSEQVPSERYYPGQRIRVYVSEVHDSHRGPQIIVSRAHRFMLRRLFEQEVPEIYNGTVEIMAIAREAGARSKVAVAARQPGIDPVGSCVGMRGVRIQNIVNELGGEKIDVVEWNEDPARFVGNALSPARVLEVRTNEAEKTATVIVPENQLSLAIGREGQNARLAAKLTGWRIDIKSDVVAAAEAQAAAEAASSESTEGGTSTAAESGYGAAGASDSGTPAGVSAVSDGRSDPVAAEASAGADS